MNLTLYHKIVISECHHNHKDIISGNLADLVAQRETIAEKYYRVVDTCKSFVKAVQIFYRMMKKPQKNEGGSNKHEIKVL